jgi:hypothetical protein
MVRTGLQAAVMAAALGASGLALAQQPTFERAGAEFERDMRAWGVATMPEIDALGEKLIPLYMPGEGLTPIDTSKCAQALPLLIDFKNKSLAAATLLTKMAEQLIAINRLSALGAVQGEAGRLRNWAAMATIDEGRCLAAAGHSVEAAIRFVQAMDLNMDGDGGNQGRDALAKLLKYE